MKFQMLSCLIAGLAVICSAQCVAQEKGNWRAASTTAKSITGDVAISDLKISINFSSYWIAQIRTLNPREIGAVFDPADDAAGSGNLYRLSIPGEKTFLHKSTLCGGEDTQWVVTYAQRHTLRLAFFSSSNMPVLTADALANTTDLCGLFSYVK